MSAALRCFGPQELTIHTSDLHPRHTAPCTLAIAIALLGWTACGPPTPAGASPAPPVPVVRPVGLVLGLTFEDEVVDDDVVRRWQTLISEASAVLWQASEGQIFVGRCTLEDRAGWGELRVPQGALELEVLSSGTTFELESPGSEHWHIFSPGRPGDDHPTAQLLAADIARGTFGLDEHDAPGETSGPGCLLADTAAHLCAVDEPRLARRACRSVIDQRWQGLTTFPNPGWSPDEPAPRTAFERLHETP